MGFNHCGEGREETTRVAMNWMDYGMGLARAASKRSKDPWRKVGAVVLRKDNSVAGVGYNGFPAGMWEDWEDRESRRKFVIHAEANALRYCKPDEGRMLCCTTLPCNECLRLIAGYGIRCIVYGDDYERDQSTIDIADYFGIDLKQISLVEKADDGLLKEDRIRCDKRIGSTPPSAGSA